MSFCLGDLGDLAHYLVAEGEKRLHFTVVFFCCKGFFGVNPLVLR